MRIKDINLKKCLKYTMIEVKNKKDCCGCSACVQICPKECIAMEFDNEGFLYPKVDEVKCINCHKCETVCPVINRYSPREPLLTIAAKNYNKKIVNISSSGGVFDLLAHEILNKGGVVFGAKLNEKMQVVHDYVEKYEDLNPLRGSKYVQSDINGTYLKVKAFLKQKRSVLFSGTPCQISGLKHFLGKDYEGLYLVEVICHGSPSPGIWKEYINQQSQKISKVAHNATDGKNMVLSLSLEDTPVFTGVNFREKNGYSWEKFGFVIRGKSALKADKNLVLLSDICFNNTYIKGFLSDLYLRPSCYQCPTRCLSSGADITLGDYWKIKDFHPKFYDKNGVSLVLINSNKGQDLFEQIRGKMDFIKSSYANAVRVNPVLVSNVMLDRKRDKFYKDYFSNPNDLERIVNTLSKRTLYDRIYKKIYYILKTKIK